MAGGDAVSNRTPCSQNGQPGYLGRGNRLNFKGVGAKSFAGEGGSSWFQCQTMQSHKPSPFPKIPKAKPDPSPRATHPGRSIGLLRLPGQPLAVTQLRRSLGKYYEIG